jgi:CRISPR type I-D-associated protein Csc1
MHAYEATLQVRNPLSFRANEYGNIVRTSKVLHNWALRFALNGVRGDPEKSHLENLKGQPIYATPAVPIEADYEFQTFHPFPEAPQMLRNPLSLGLESRRSYQARVTILHYKESARVGSTFRFAVASKDELPQKIVITYGGKQTLQEVQVDAADSFTEPGPFKGQITHPINPLDFLEPIKMVHAFEHAIPPSPLFEGTVTEAFTARLMRKGFREYVVPPSW